MIKSNILRTVISVLAVMILIGIALLIYTHFSLDRDDVIRMDLEDEDGGTVQFEDLCLLPGESSEYTLLITNKLKNEKEPHEFRAVRLISFAIYACVFCCSGH